MKRVGILAFLMLTGCEVDKAMPCSGPDACRPGLGGLGVTLGGGTPGIKRAQGGFPGSDKADAGTDGGGDGG
jgi:hypothetical protein